MCPTAANDDFQHSLTPASEEEHGNEGKNSSEEKHAREEEIGKEEEIAVFLEAAAERPTPVADLPSPEETPGFQDLPWRPPSMGGVLLVNRGLLSGMIRAVQKIPPCVWVVNKHVEDIVVVVSNYRPNRLLTGGGINIGTTGAGFDLSTTTFQGPATRKTLARHARDPEAGIAVFPLWTRNEGFGVISIFTGPEQTLYIENDRIPLGATAHFLNKPNLMIVEYEKMSG